ncbi:MAG: Asp-tRNA(Asn)/Glu-tRNA(Gln) amidotransferase GatCAB subunit A [Chloroflexi bacterium HGW-Chloroflexi-10]|nr:MAG: Asp-tRNA(Asn)/Glu-tRNA(Gln) amidotransferase GatCAB subunit A [Chloroflexi bacterium HGW-Chloroflexi-10]
MSIQTGFTVRQCLDALQNGQVTSVQLVQAYLDRITTLEPQVQAFITLIAEQALTLAQAADTLRTDTKDTQSLPPLLGLPIAIKDVLTLANVRCTCGSRILVDFVPPHTATAVQRLVDAGVIIIGKTNMDEFAMGSSTENSAFHTTHNPWDLTRVPGGSSGGSAAAVAARFIPAALGSDTGGSVRQPASFCGISGLKPTYGRISRYGLVAYGSSLDTVGAFAQTVEDISLFFPHMAGLDEHDATSMDVPVPSVQLDGNTSLNGLRVGVPNEYFIEGMQPAVEKAVREAIAHLEKLGAQIVPVSLPHTKYALPVYYLIAPAEASANLARYEGVRFGYSADASNLLEMFKQSRGTGFGSEVKRRIMLGTYALSAGYYDAYYGQAQKVRTLIKRDFENAFRNVDVIATPVAPSTAFRIGEHSNDPLAMYLEDVFTLPINLAGVPALALPCGFDEEQLPIGMQLIGPHFKEDLLFRVGHAYQLTTEWHKQAPEL